MQANADEEEFDGEETGLAEGEYLTAEEKAAILRGFEESDSDYSDQEEDGNGSVQSGAMEEEGGHVRPVDEEMEGVQGLRQGGNDDGGAESGDEGAEEGQETQQQEVGVVSSLSSCLFT